MKRMLIAGCVVTALAIVGLAIHQLLSNDGKEQGSQHDAAKQSSSPTPRFPGDLLAGNRTHLSLCVDKAGLNTPSSSATSADAKRVKSAVSSALATLHPVPSEFGKPSVTAGCPSPIALTGKQLNFYDLCCNLAKVTRDPAELSPYRIFIYFVPDKLYAASLGDFSPYAKATAETLCEGDTCGEMTVSIYAPDSIADGLALEPRTPKPTMDWGSCNRGTPRPERELYLRCLSPSTEDVDCERFWQKVHITPPPQ